MESSDQGERPAFLDKLLQTCIVRLEEMDILPCEICDNDFYGEENLMKHLITHVNVQSNTTECKEKNLRSCSTGYKHTESNIADTGCNTNTSNTVMNFERNVKKLKKKNAPLSVYDHNILDNHSKDTSVVNKNSNFKGINICKKKKLDDITNTSKCVIKRSRKLHSCSICKKTFDKVSILKEHVLTHQEKVHVVFDDNAQHIAVQSKLKEGKKIDSSNVYGCNICQKFFRLKQYLNRHLKTHTSIKPYKCTLCYKMFKLKEQLQKHNRVHTDERRYSCVKCNIRFRNSSSFYYHKRHYHESAIALPTCAICNKQYKEKRGILKHIYLVHVTKGYQCRICKKEFGHPVIVSSHMKVHSLNQRKFCCGMCDKWFKSNFHLDRHFETHSLRKSYQCDKCKKCFRRKDHLAPHIRKTCK